MNNLIITDQGKIMNRIVFLLFSLFSLNSYSAYLCELDSPQVQGTEYLFPDNIEIIGYEENSEVDRELQLELKTSYWNDTERYKIQLLNGDKKLALYEVSELLQTNHPYGKKQYNLDSVKIKTTKIRKQQLRRISKVTINLSFSQAQVIYKRCRSI